MKYEIKNKKTKERMRHTGEFRYKALAEILLVFLLVFGLNGKWEVRQIIE